MIRHQSRTDYAPLIKRGITGGPDGGNDTSCNQISFIKSFKCIHRGSGIYRGYLENYVSCYTSSCLLHSVCEGISLRLLIS